MELLVVITIIGLLVALLLPALTSARATAIAAGANMNLNGFGRAFLLNSDQDVSERGLLSTGAFDLHRDGDVRKVGWVADVIKLKVANPNKANDGSNSSKLNEKLLDYAGATNTSSTGNINPRLWAASSNVYYGGTNGPKDATGWTAGQKRENLWDAGYNTNFATSWHFSRGDEKKGVANAVTVDADTRDRGKSPLDGEGPLSEDKLMKCKASRDIIALMANSRNGDGSDAAIDSTIAEAVNNFFGFETGGSSNDKPIAKSGDLAVESFTDGKNCNTYPSAVGAAFNISSNGAGSSASLHDDCLHELGDFYPVVGSRKDGNNLFSGGFAQVLFADGHVGKIRDEGGWGATEAAEAADGWIGPNKQGGPTGATNSSAKYELTASGLKEVRGKIWLKDLGDTEAGRGGGD